MLPMMVPLIAMVVKIPSWVGTRVVGGSESVGVIDWILLAVIPDNVLISIGNVVTLMVLVVVVVVVVICVVAVGRNLVSMNNAMFTVHINYSFWLYFWLTFQVCSHNPFYQLYQSHTVCLGSRNKLVFRFNCFLLLIGQARRCG